MGKVFLNTLTSTSGHSRAACLPLYCITELLPLDDTIAPLSRHTFSSVNLPFCAALCQRETLTADTTRANLLTPDLHTQRPCSVSIVSTFDLPGNAKHLNHETIRANQSCRGFQTE